MCRKTHLRGCILLGIGIGLLIGQCLESWFLCSCGGVTLVIVGFCALGRN